MNYIKIANCATNFTENVAHFFYAVNICNSSPSLALLRTEEEPEEWDNGRDGGRDCRPWCCCSGASVCASCNFYSFIYLYCCPSGCYRGWFSISIHEKTKCVEIRIFVVHFATALHEGLVSLISWDFGSCFHHHNLCSM